MTRVEYKKLIRDRVKEQIEKAGDLCEIQTLDGQVFQTALRAKLLEEAQELAGATAREDFLSEYADLMVVLDELASLYELSAADIKVSLSENLEKKGGFKNKHFLVWSKHKD